MPPPSAEYIRAPRPPTWLPAHLSFLSTRSVSNLPPPPHTASSSSSSPPPSTNTAPAPQLDSAFQLQEHLAALHYYHTRSNTVPITRETAKLLATPPPSIDRTLWLYELCRFLIAQCNSLIVGFLFDTPPCSAATCPEMRASEWQFLCAVHDAPKSCCAIDYCCHTLDWAANVVTNPKIFPSRFVAPLSDGHDKGAALKNLVNVFRRLHRIFAHAWFQHRGVFWSVEGQTGLYVFFKTVCDLYDLLPAENYKLPPEAEGLEAPTAGLEVGSGDKKHQASAGGQHQVVTAIARPPSAVERTGTGAGAGAGQSSLDDDAFNSAAARTNTRRHIRSNPSTGNAISMVPEVDEDADGHAAGLAGRMKAMSLQSAASQPQPAVPRVEEDQGEAGAETEAEAEAEAADVPVIVLDDGNDAPARREMETKVETKETAENDDEEEASDAVPEKKKEDHDLVQEEQPAEADLASVVVENELEKPVSEPSVEPSEAQPEPAEAQKEGEEDESGEAGDETVIPSDDEVKEAEPAEAEETALGEVEEEKPPVSAIQSKEFDEAVAKEDPAAAAAVVGAASEEKGDLTEGKSDKAEEAEAGHAEKPEEVKGSEDEGKAGTEEKE